MLNRREVLHGALGMIGAAVGGPLPLPVLSQPKRLLAWVPELERTLTYPRALSILGIPKSWSQVHDGLHPFAPERVVVIPDRPLLTGRRALRERVLRTARERLLDNPPNRPIEYEASDYLIEMADILTRHYGIEGCLEDAANDFVLGHYDASFWNVCDLGYARRRLLASRAGQCSPIATANENVDWWLFLLPNGLWDDSTPPEKRPVGLILPIWENDPSICLIYPLWLMEDAALTLAGYHWEPIPTFGRIFNMEADDLCRLLNARVSSMCVWLPSGLSIRE